MTIEMKKEKKSLTLKIAGRLDTTSAPEMEKAVKENIGSVEELVIDMENLEYISSAGLRVLLSAQKTMNGQGSMKVINVSDTIMEIFEITGFNEIMTIKWFFSDISEGILVIGLNGSFQYFNRAATDIPDKTKEELSNRKLRILTEMKKYIENNLGDLIKLSNDVY